jgi:two-component system, cell cycle sensor histidine kinase and response regulator CckA
VSSPPPEVEPKIARTNSQRLAQLGLVTVAYFVVVRTGVDLFRSSGGFPFLFPSAGFLLGWLILTSRREWPLIAAFAFVAHGVASPLFMTAPLAGAGISAAEVIATVACAMIMGGGRAAGEDHGRIIEHLMRFVLATTLVSAPMFAVIASLLGPGEHSVQMLGVHGSAYLLGVLVVAPPILTAEPAIRWLKDSAWMARLELASALTVTAVMLYGGYLLPVADEERLRPINILLVLPLLWLGMRIGPFGAAWGSALVGVVIAYSTSHGTGLYAIVAGGESRHQVLFSLYVGVAVTLALTNAVIVDGLRRALTTVANTERWFRELANASPLAMIVVEADQNTMFFNKALTKLYGYKPEEIRTVESFWRHVIPDADERLVVTREWLSRVEESRRLGTTVRPLESRGVAADGTYKYVEAHGSEIGGRRLILLVDRTADLEAQATRSAGEQAFRQLVDSAPIPIMVIEPDQTTLTVNRTFTELLGYEGPELPDVAAYLEHVFPDPAYRKRMDDTWNRHLAEWRETGGSFRPVTAQFTCRDGSVVFLEARTSPVGARRITTLMDLTERQRSEAALRASETQFRAMFDSSALAISLVDLSGRPMKTNRALTQLLGYTERELCAKSWMSVTHPEDIETDVSLFNELVVGERDAYQVEKRYVRKDRGVVFARVTLSLIRDAAGEPTFYVSMVEDITKRTVLEGALRQAQKMEAVGQLTSGISHDFNNLLSIIIGNIELVIAQLGKDAAPVERELADVTEAAHRGAEMIRKLLGFSRQAELRKEPVNLSAVVSGFVRMLRRLLPSDIEVRIVLDPSADALTVRADVGAVEQILVNLATNARDAMPRGGSLQIKVRRGELTDADRASRPWLTDGDYVALAVTDTGTGMDSATLALVFEPFFTTKGEGKGTGLGMAMIDGLAKQHEGFVDVESAIGAGTTVRVWFPVVAEGAWAFEGPVPDSSEIRGGTETILLVEDKEALRRVTKRLLEGLGYTVIPAADGAQALKLYNRNRDRIDLVVTDMVMPKLHGHELYRAVRNTESTVPFVFASGYSPAELRSRAALGEDVKHLPKPVTLETLAKAIREALNPLRRRRPDESLQESRQDP